MRPKILRIVTCCYISQLKTDTSIESLYTLVLDHLLGTVEGVRILHLHPRSSGLGRVGRVTLLAALVHDPRLNQVNWVNCSSSSNSGQRANEEPTGRGWLLLVESPVTELQHHDHPVPVLRTINQLYVHNTLCHLRAGWRKKGMTCFMYCSGARLCRSEYIKVLLLCRRSDREKRMSTLKIKIFVFLQDEPEVGSALTWSSHT